MTDTSTFVAFASSDRLHQLTDGFIQRMRSPGARAEPETIERIMAMFMEEALAAFMIRPSELSGLSPTLMRVILFTTETITKASQVVIRSTAKKLNVAQNRDIADYMDKVRRPHGDHWYICLPINDTLLEHGRTGFQLAIDGDLRQATPRMLAYFHGVTDLAMKWYFEDPIQLLRLGPILRKVADVGVTTTRKATHTMIDSVIPKLDAHQAKVTGEYTLGLIRQLPARAD